MAAKNSDAGKKEPYPWATLFSIESNIHPIVVEREKGRVGRPHKAISRRKTSHSLTDEELRLLEEVTHALRMKMHPAKVYKSQVLGFAIRMLKIKMDGLEDSIESWEDLALTLIGETEGA